MKKRRALPSSRRLASGVFHVCPSALRAEEASKGQPFSKFFVERADHLLTRVQLYRPFHCRSTPIQQVTCACDPPRTPGPSTGERSFDSDCISCQNHHIRTIHAYTCRRGARRLHGVACLPLSESDMESICCLAKTLKHHQRARGLWGASRWRVPPCHVWARPVRNNINPLANLGHRFCEPSPTQSMRTHLQARSVCREE